MNSEQSLIAELEAAMTSGSQDKRVDTLRRITDLFVADAARFNDRELKLFDDVMESLVKRIEGKALAELSHRLAPVPQAPSGVVRQLAHHDDIAVAEPILSGSAVLTDVDLIEIANSKTQAHLFAISGRPRIDGSVTDVLLRRGDHRVFHRLAENHGAGFSDQGFAKLVRHAEADHQLAEKVGLRHDVPLPLFRELLSRATELVRARLLSSAGPEARGRIQAALASIADGERQLAGFQSERDFAKAHELVEALHKHGELSEVSLVQFAHDRRYAEIIAGLSLLCGAPMQLVETLLQSPHRETFLVPCKAAGLAWTTVGSLLPFRTGARPLSETEQEALWSDYLKLSPSSAARVLRFWQVRQATTKDASAAPKPEAAVAAAG